MKQQLNYYDIDRITKLKDNEVFVFGSNPEGRHGKGAAKVAHDKFGAKYGIGRGWCSNNSYAIPTKNLKYNFTETLKDGTIIIHKEVGKQSISLRDIKLSVLELYNEAMSNKDKLFYIAYTNNSSNLNGYSSMQMFECFTKDIFVPENILFHSSFCENFKEHKAIQFYKKWGKLDGKYTTIT